MLTCNSERQSEDGVGIRAVCEFVADTRPQSYKKGKNNKKRKKDKK